MIKWWQSTCIQVVPHLGGVTTQMSPSRTYTVECFLCAFKQRLSLGFDYCHLHVIYLVDGVSGDELVKEEEVPRVTQHIPRLSVYILQLARCWFLLV